jgi:hypothetical protein
MTLEHRERVDLDQTWSYHVLIVPLLASTSRGIMFYAFGTDSNNVPREGVAMSSDWVFPLAGILDWGNSAGKRFADESSSFFRTAIHELGHAFGLIHESGDNGFMATSDTIAGRGTSAQRFPANIKWAFSDHAIQCLQHYPDAFFRPGGIPFGDASTVNPPISDSPSGPLKLDVNLLNTSLPLGAPVRASVTLTNTSSNPIRVPHSLNLKSGFLQGGITDSGGKRRIFSPLVQCVDENRLLELHDGESITTDLVLMRGRQGALAPFQETIRSASK